MDKSYQFQEPEPLFYFTQWLSLSWFEQLVPCALTLPCNTAIFRVIIRLRPLVTQRVIL